MSAAILKAFPEKDNTKVQQIIFDEDGRGRFVGNTLDQLVHVFAVIARSMTDQTDNVSAETFLEISSKIPWDQVLDQLEFTVEDRDGDTILVVGSGQPDEEEIFELESTRPTKRWKKVLTNEISEHFQRFEEALDTSFPIRIRSSTFALRSWILRRLALEYLSRAVRNTVTGKALSDYYQGTNRGESLTSSPHSAEVTQQVGMDANQGTSGVGRNTTNTIPREDEILSDHSVNESSQAQHLSETQAVLGHSRKPQTQTVVVSGQLREQQTQSQPLAGATGGDTNSNASKALRLERSDEAPRPLRDTIVTVPADQTRSDPDGQHDLVEMRRELIVLVHPLQTHYLNIKRDPTSLAKHFGLWGECLEEIDSQLTLASAILMS